MRIKLRAEFILFGKINVNGKDACELYRFLRLNSKLEGKQIGWNFGKFIVDKRGNIRNYFTSKQYPLSFEADVVNLLNEN